MRRLFMILLVASSALALTGCGGGMNLFGGSSASSGAGQAGLVPAAPGAGGKAAPDSFAVYDRDANGIVPKAEMEEAIAAQFRKDDLNADGFLDATEVRAVNDRLMTDPGSTPIIDWNADGKVLMPEYASQWRTLFDQADVDGDGLVDAEERAGRARHRKPPPLPQPELGGYRGKSSLVPVP
jgi:hypothetical protein